MDQIEQTKRPIILKPTLYQEFIRLSNSTKRFYSLYSLFNDLLSSKRKIIKVFIISDEK